MSMSQYEYRDRQLQMLTLQTHVLRYRMGKATKHQKNIVPGMLCHRVSYAEAR